MSLLLDKGVGFTVWRYPCTPKIEGHPGTTGPPQRTQGTREDERKEEGSNRGGTVFVDRVLRGRVFVEVPGGLDVVVDHHYCKGPYNTPL